MVGEMASVKRRKLEDGRMGCVAPAVPSKRLDPSSLLEERSEIPIVFVVSFVLSVTPQTGGNGQGIIDGCSIS